MAPTRKRPPPGLWPALGRAHLAGAVAQLGERLVRNEEVRGSTPLGSTSRKPRQNGALLRFRGGAGGRVLRQLVLQRASSSGNRQPAWQRNNFVAYLCSGAPLLARSAEY